MPKRKFEEISQTQTYIDSKRQKIENVCDYWKSPSNFMNFLRDDCLLDFLEKAHITDVETYQKFKNGSYELKDRKKRYVKNHSLFTQNLFSKGKEFEDKIFCQLLEIAKIYNLSTTTICSNYRQIFIHSFYESTKNAMLNGIDIILHGVVKSFKHRLYGQPDIIISGKAIRKIFQKKCPQVKDTQYYIIDVKNKTIPILICNLISKGKSYDPYKIQVYTYAFCINEMIGSFSDKAFLLGNKYTQGKEIYTPLETLAEISFSIDKLFIDEKFASSIKWQNNLERNWKSWKLNPPSLPELYPNMCNIYDDLYRDVKNTLAKDLGEITQMYYCNVDNRKHAFSKNVYSIHDKNISPEILGIQKNNSVYEIVQGMINIKNSNQNLYIPKNNNHLLWREQKEMDFFIDFETFIDDEGYNWLYLIGVHYIENGQSQNKSFVLSKLSQKYEKGLILDFLNFFQIKTNYKIWHWGKHEHNVLSKKFFQYIFKGRTLPVLFDLCEVFRNRSYPIIVKNCYNFSIKTISKELYNMKLIQSHYEELDSGSDSIIIARNFYENKSSFDDLMKLIQYNNTDCILLREILVCIRNFFNS